ncbi:MAG: hypothetical protein GY937_23020 [bacterium]|nr:hypothetical protein [bacterium]
MQRDADERDPRPWAHITDAELREAVATHHRVYGLSLSRISREARIPGTTVAHVMSGRMASPDDETRRRLVIWLMGQGWEPKHEGEA